MYSLRYEGGFLCHPVLEVDSAGLAEGKELGLLDFPFLVTGRFLGVDMYDIVKQGIKAQIILNQQ